MPIKWDAVADQTLLLAMIETSPNLTADYRAISEAWPEPNGPTPKAISERIARLKRMANNRAGDVNAGSTPPSAKKPRTTKKGAVAKPRKPKATKPNGTATAKQNQMLAENLGDEDVRSDNEEEKIKPEVTDGDFEDDTVRSEHAEDFQ